MVRVVSAQVRDVDFYKYTQANIVPKKRPLDELEEEDHSGIKAEDPEPEKEVFHNSKTTLDPTDTAIPVKPLHPRAVKFELTESTRPASSFGAPGEKVEAKPSLTNFADSPFTTGIITDGSTKFTPAESPFSTLSWEEVVASSLVAAPAMTTYSNTTAPLIKTPTKLVATVRGDQTPPFLKALKELRYENYKSRLIRPQSPSSSTSIETPSSSQSPDSLTVNLSEDNTLIEPPLSAQTLDSLVVNLSKGNTQTTPDKYLQAPSNESLEANIRKKELLKEFCDKVSDLRTGSFLRTKMVEARQQVKIDALQRENSSLLEEKSQDRQEIGRLGLKLAIIEAERQIDKRKILQSKKLLREVSIHADNVRNLFPNMSFHNDQERITGEKPSMNAFSALRELEEKNKISG
jgi:hypothetical protein